MTKGPTTFGCNTFSPITLMVTPLTQVHLLLPSLPLSHLSLTIDGSPRVEVTVAKQEVLFPTLMQWYHCNMIKLSFNIIILSFVCQCNTPFQRQKSGLNIHQFFFQEINEDLKPLVLGLGALSLLLLALVLLLLLCLHKHRREVNGDTKKVWNVDTF